jgi:hypothetical protein
VKHRTIEIDRIEIIEAGWQTACAAATQFHRKFTELSLKRSLIRHTNKTSKYAWIIDRLILKANDSSKRYAGGTLPAIVHYLNSSIV